jgi:hypothetical protein
VAGGRNPSPVMDVVLIPVPRALIIIDVVIKTTQMLAKRLLSEVGPERGLRWICQVG